MIEEQPCIKQESEIAYRQIKAKEYVHEWWLHCYIIAAQVNTEYILHLYICGEF